MRTAVREVAVFILFLALAIALTWPLAIRIDTTVPDLGDPLLNAWILDWVSYALVHQPLDLFDAPIFHPAELPLAYSENLIGIALFALPFHLAGLPALTVYNIILLLGFAHAAYGGYVLGRVVSGSMVPALLSGIFFGFVSYKFDHLSHLQIIWSGWLPLLLAAVIAYWRRPSWPRALLVGGAFLMNGLTNIHFLLFGAVAVMFAIAVMAYFDFRREARFWIGLFGALAVAGAILLPVLMPYREVRTLYGMKRDPGEVEWFSGTWSDWLNTTTRARFYGRYMTDEVRHERALFPGMLPIFLLASAIVLAPRRDGLARRADGDPPRGLLKALDVVIVLLAMLIWFGAVSERFVITSGNRNLLAVRGVDIASMLFIVTLIARLSIRFPKALGGTEGRSLRSAAAESRFSPAAWAAAVWIIIGILGSLGLNAFFHTFLYQRVEGFAALRVPARWAVITYAGLAVWIALGASELLRNRSPRWRNAVAAILLVLAVGEVIPIIRWEHAPVDVPPVYRWLNQTRVGPVLELPPDAIQQFIYLLYATEHRVPIMNGTSGFEPPPHEYLRLAWERKKLDESFTRFLEQSGCRIIIVHGNWVAHAFDEMKGWLRSESAAGRIRFLQRFQNGINGDYVFAVTKNLPDWPTYRGPMDRDRAGFTPEENLVRFLSAETTYNAGLFGRIDAPRPWEVHSRPLHIAGWALSPDGIRSATALIDNGRLRIPMELHDRPDVRRRFPWYPNVPKAGFAINVPRRPKGTPRETDLQVEVIDGAGRKLMLRDVPFRWN